MQNVVFWIFISNIKAECKWTDQVLSYYHEYKYIKHFKRSVGHTKACKTMQRTSYCLEWEARKDNLLIGYFSKSIILWEEVYAMEKAQRKVWKPWYQSYTMKTLYVANFDHQKTVQLEALQVGITFWNYLNHNTINRLATKRIFVFLWYCLFVWPLENGVSY